MTVMESARHDLVTISNVDPLDHFALKFWIWFYDNKRMVVASLLFWKVRLEDLSWLFEKIFGKMPPVRV